jgi:DNA-binding NarL/FixJ family response regulator
MSVKTILYVEDNELNRKMLRHLLRSTSYRLIEAPDGETGITMAREQHPDLILMDVQLPKISGIETTREDPTDRIATIGRRLNSSPRSSAEPISCAGEEDVQGHRLRVAIDDSPPAPGPPSSFSSGRPRHRAGSAHE